MIHAEVELTKQGTTVGAQADLSLAAWSFAMQKLRLAENRFPQRVIDQMDHFTQFDRIQPDQLSQSHRWTTEDIGKTFVGFENPKNSSKGIVFEVAVTSVFERSQISFEVTEAYDLTWVLGKSWSVRHFGPFLNIPRFTIDAENPFQWVIMDRVCEMLDDDSEVHDRLRLYMAIQDWALQPNKSYQH